MGMRWGVMRRRIGVVRPLGAVLTVLFALLGIGVTVPGIGATASACTCGYPPNEPIPTDLVVISGEVEKQLVGARTVDIQVRVTSMYGAPPEAVTVVRSESGSSSSCGNEFSEGQTVRLVVKRGGPRWEYPTCANAVLGRSDAPDFTGSPPGPGAEEHRLPGPPASWFYSGLGPEELVVGAILIACVGLIAAAAARLRRGRR